MDEARLASLRVGAAPAVLLRESWREDGKVRKRTLANLSCLSSEVIEGLKVLLRGGVAVASASVEAFGAQPVCSVPATDSAASRSGTCRPKGQTHERSPSSPFSVAIRIN